MRLGVGRPPGRQDPADFVLSSYTAAERKVLPFQVDRAADAVESLIEDGLEHDAAAVQRLTWLGEGRRVDDHELAAWAADQAGALLLDVRARAWRARSSRTPATSPPTSC